MEFSISDYSVVRNQADSIKNTADSIMGIFDDIDRNMKDMYGEMWQSSGADVSNGKYNELRKNYEVFYEKVVAMRNHIYKVAASNEAADVNVQNSILG